MKYLTASLALLAVLALAGPASAQWEWEPYENEWVYDMSGYEVDPTGGYEDIGTYGTGYYGGYGYGTDLYDDYGYGYGGYDYTYGEPYDAYETGLNGYDYDAGIYDDTAGIYDTGYYGYDTDDDWWDWW